MEGRACMVLLQDPSGEAAAEAFKQLVYYELDLGLNHVIRKWSQPIASTANFLLAVPGERSNGPGEGRARQPPRSTSRQEGCRWPEKGTQGLSAVPLCLCVCRRCADRVGELDRLHAPGPPRATHAVASQGGAAASEGHATGGGRHAQAEGHPLLPHPVRVRRPLQGACEVTATSRESSSTSPRPSSTDLGGECLDVRRVVGLVGGGGR